MPKPINLTGRTFGLLEVVERTGAIRHRQALWRCRCVCGGEIARTSTALTKGVTTSCGCATSEAISRGRRTHGQSKSGLYRRWMAMNTRCTNPNADNYGRYGGRGISVHPEWRRFEAFERDMGVGFSSELELDRIDTNGNYEPGNCRWVPRTVNSLNKRNTIWVTLWGQEKTLKEWVDLFGLKYRTAHQRLVSRGWDAERALTEGVNEDAIARVRGESAAHHSKCVDR